MKDEQMMAQIMEMQKSMTVLQQDVKAAFRRIDEHTKLVESVHELALSVRDHTGELKRLGELHEEMRADLDELKAEPAKRWDALIGSGIAAVVGAVIGWLVKR